MGKAKRGQVLLQALPHAGEDQHSDLPGATIVPGMHA